MDKTDLPLGDQTIDQLLGFRPSSTRDGPFTVWRRTALSPRRFAPCPAFRRRRRSDGHHLNAIVRKPRIVGMTTMPKVEPAGLSDLHLDIPTTLADLQQATVAQGMDRVPFLRRPGSRFLTGREPLQKRSPPFVRGGPPVHEPQPAPHIMRTVKTAGQEPFTAGSRMATHST